MKKYIGNVSVKTPFKSVHRSTFTNASRSGPDAVLNGSQHNFNKNMPILPNGSSIIYVPLPIGPVLSYWNGVSYEPFIFFNEYGQGRFFWVNNLGYRFVDFHVLTPENQTQAQPLTPFSASVVGSRDQATNAVGLQDQFKGVQPLVTPFSGQNQSYSVPPLANVATDVTQGVPVVNDAVGLQDQFKGVQPLVTPFSGQNQSYSVPPLANVATDVTQSVPVVNDAVGLQDQFKGVQPLTSPLTKEEGLRLINILTKPKK